MEVDVLIAGVPRYDVRMGKRIGLVAVAALLLTGCASTELASEQTAVPSESATATPEAAPIEVKAAEEAPDEDVDATYLEAVKSTWIGDVLPADGELLQAGRYACQEFPKGLHYTEVVAVSGEGWEAADNNLKVTGNAGRYLCPEFDPSL